MNNSKRILILFIHLICFVQKSLSSDSPCGSWHPYLDEKCFTIIDDTPRSFPNATKTCATLDHTSTLAIIRSQAEQDFLANYLFKELKKLNPVWIGAKFVNSKFTWIDNSTWSYTNWEKAPRNRANYCVQMQADEDVRGKWIDEPCEMPSLAVCEKVQSLSIAELHKMMIDSRKEMQDSLAIANKQIAELKQNLADSRKETNSLKQNLIPIGFIYVQLPKDKSPKDLWSWMTWTEVSSTYPGVFFRVTGGEAAEFGVLQEDNVPHISQVSYLGDCGGLLTSTMKKGGWSDPVVTGIFGNGGTHNCNKYLMTGGEVRPKNMAVRVWKRTG